MIHNQFVVSHLHEFSSKEEKADDKKLESYAAFVIVYDVNVRESLDRAKIILKLIVQNEQNQQRGRDS